MATGEMGNNGSSTMAITDGNMGDASTITPASFVIATPERASKRKTTSEAKPTSPGVLDHNGKYLFKFEGTSRAADGSPLWGVPGKEANQPEITVWRELAKIRGILVQAFKFIHNIVKGIKEDGDAGPMPRVVKDHDKLRHEFDALRAQLDQPQARGSRPW